MKETGEDPATLRRIDGIEIENSFILTSVGGRKKNNRSMAPERERNERNHDGTAGTVQEP